MTAPAESRRGSLSSQIRKVRNDFALHLALSHWHLLCGWCSEQLVPSPALWKTNKELYILCGVKSEELHLYICCSWQKQDEWPQAKDEIQSKIFTGLMHNPGFINEPRVSDGVQHHLCTWQLPESEEHLLCLMCYLEWTQLRPEMPICLMPKYLLYWVLCY